MANVYSMVTDRIVEQMKEGIIPWQKPWVGGSGVAIGYESRKPYSLLNQFLLGKPGEWLTWNQIKARGGNVKKGAKSRFVVFYQPVVKTEKDEKTGKEKIVEQYPILRWYKVFHLDDIEGVESRIEKVEADTNIKPIDKADKVANDYVSREEGLSLICDKQSASAYYSPSTDTVVVPALSQYAIVEEYYSTLFHELTHSTMTESRCNRKAEGKIAAFGDANYSREELVAEIGSAMILNSIGIACEKAFKNSVGYIQHWIKALKNDERMIVWASSRAEKAAKYILNENE